MDNKLNIKTKMSYGRVLYYPDCRVSQILADISGKKTLSAEELKKLTSAGFEISYDEEKNEEKEGELK